MRDIVRRTKEQLRQRLSEKEKAPERQARQPSTQPLQSVDGILKSAARLGTVAFMYWAAQTVGDLWSKAKREVEDEQRAARNERKAARDLEETKKRQDEQDTASIRRQISKDFVDRERKNLPTIPKSVRGRWEGHVFIPYDLPTPANSGKGSAKTQGKALPKAPKSTGG